VSRMAICPQSRRHGKAAPARTKMNTPNSRPTSPLLWSGKLLPKRAVFNQLSGREDQLVHINGLTYDFLLDISRELAQKEACWMVGPVRKQTQR